MKRPPPAWTIFASAVLLGPLLGSGCSLYYRNQFRSERFRLFSDLDQELLNEVGPDIERIYRGYQSLLEPPPRTLGRTTIILEGKARDERIIDLAYSPSLLGYYVPLLNLISVDTRAAWAREPGMLRQILLHEVSHHFIVACFPSLSRECWFNEGLAGNLEMSLFGDGRMETPLLNPVLLGIAQRAARQGHPAVDLERLLSLGWREFHSGETREIDYALSWSIVYFLLERRLLADLTLRAKLDRIESMQRAELLQSEPEWIGFLVRFDLTDELIALSREDPKGPLGRLTPAWALRLLGQLRCLDDERVGNLLIEEMGTDDAARVSEARIAFLSLMGRHHSSSIHPHRWRQGREKIAAAALDASASLGARVRLIRAIGEVAPYDADWTSLLVWLLESPDGDLRAAAARGLGSLSLKPTVVNPAFWRDGHSAARAGEVEEWRLWLKAHGTR